MRRCRFCAEEIQDAAMICKHCGKNQARSEAPKVIGIILALAIGGGILIVILTALTEDKTKLDPYRFGTETRLITSKGCCLVAKSESDLVELTRMAQTDDELSIRQMIIGGRVWSQAPGSRVTVLGKGTYSSGVEVRFMDGKTGWLGPKMLQ